jgi:hypothetical protein
MTQPGARAVFEGLKNGAVTLDSPSLQGVWVPYEMRQAIHDEWAKEIMQEGIDLGLTHTGAEYRLDRIMKGADGLPGLNDIIWDDRISYEDKYHFQQLNTTYAMGPSGRPMATNYTRTGSMANWFGLKPFQETNAPASDLTPADIVGNTTVTVGPFGSVNTGLRGLKLIDDSRYIPTDKEIGDAIIKAIGDAKDQVYEPNTPEKKTGNGYYGGRHFSYGGSGYGGGGGGGGGYPNFQRMYTFPHARLPYGNKIPYGSMSTPSPRRADVHRERVWSERGRLKQWQ